MIGISLIVELNRTLRAPAVYLGLSSAVERSMALCNVDLGGSWDIPCCPNLLLPTAIFPFAFLKAFCMPPGPGPLSATNSYYLPSKVGEIFPRPGHQCSDNGIRVHYGTL